MACEEASCESTFTCGRLVICRGEEGSWAYIAVFVLEESEFVGFGELRYEIENECWEIVSTSISLWFDSIPRGGLSLSE